MSYKSPSWMRLYRSPMRSLENGIAVGGLAVLARSAVFCTALILMSAAIPQSNAEPLSRASCVAKLQRFVLSIDDLLAHNITDDESFWSVIREDLPANGCNVSEVISISKKSKFFTLYQASTYYTITFENENEQVSFQIQKGT